MSKFTDLLHHEITFSLDDVIWLLAAILATLVFLVVLEHLIRSPHVADIDRKYVLITGCDTGFGRNAALRLDKLGCHVIAGCLTDGGAADLEEAASSRLRTLTLDVTDSESIKRAVEFVKRVLPVNTGLWGVVNNAGVLGVLGPMNWHGRDDIQATFDVNVYGMCDVTRQFLPLVKQARGRIVNTASVLGHMSLVYTGPYCMSKHAVEALSDAYRYELHPFGVSVHIIEPGAYRTPFMDTTAVEKSLRYLWNKQPDEVKEEYGEDFLKHVTWQGTTLMPLVGATNMDDVPKAYEHALFSRLPKKRYRVGLMGILAYLPSVITDWVYRLPLMRNIPAACRS